SLRLEDRREGIPPPDRRPLSRSRPELDAGWKDDRVLLGSQRHVSDLDDSAGRKRSRAAHQLRRVRKLPRLVSRRTSDRRQGDRRKWRMALDRSGIPSFPAPRAVDAPLRRARAILASLVVARWRLSRGYLLESGRFPRFRGRLLSDR